MALCFTQKEKEIGFEVSDQFSVTSLLLNVNVWSAARTYWSIQGIDTLVYVHFVFTYDFLVPTQTQTCEFTATNLQEVP